MSSDKPKKHKFKAEVKQVLDIVVNSLYTDKEVFIRELISNASDALEKLRHLQLTEKDIFDENLPLEIAITTNEQENTITIEDHGIGMTEKGLVDNLGTIAHSDSKAFLKALDEGSEVSENLIGQFGVGFYSSFMVAKSVEVYTHYWQKDGKHLLWKSSGSGNYEIDEVNGVRRGTKIVVHLKDEHKEFSNPDRVKSVLNEYSSFVQFPIKLNGEQVNNIQAIWMRNKNEIKEDEYTEFYKFQANAFDEPRYTLHFSSEAPLEINSLLFVPKESPEKWGFGRIDPGVSLYCKKILIDSRPKDLLPEWLRFLKGVIDSSDLPLNISRETMQDSSLAKKIGQVVTNRFLKFLDEKSKKEVDKYEEFYNQFGIFIKEGIASDFNYRDQLLKLLRLESSYTEKGKFTSFEDYASRMKDDQKEIYYLYAPSREDIEGGPYYELFKAKNIELLYLYEPIDEFVMTAIRKFDDKDLVSADNSDINLGDITPDKGNEVLSDEDAKGLCEWIKENLGEKVKEVGVSRRLVDSPVIALNADKFINPSVRRMMKAMKQEVDSKNSINLEINPGHELIKNLNKLKSSNSDLAKLVTDQIYDNALLTSGLLDDTREMVGRVYKILEKVSEA